MTGSFRNLFLSLARTKPKTWKGWAVVFWDHAHCVALFDKKPGRWGEDKRIDFDKAIEGIHLDFLADLGLDFLKGRSNEELEKEFYDKNLESRPVQVKLILPETLLEQMGLA